MIKKLFLLFLATLAIFSLSACTAGQKTVTYAPGPKIKICVTISPLYVMTADLINTRRNIFLEQIVPSDADISNFNLSDEQVTYFSSFDICIINGLGLDEQIAEKLSQANPKLIILNTSEGIEPILKDNGEPNPYIWLSPICSTLQIKNIAQLISEKDIIVLNEKEKEKLEKEKNAHIQKTAKEEIRNRAILSSEKVFKTYNETLSSLGLKPLQTTGSLDLLQFNEMMRKAEMPLSIDTKNIRTTGELRPIISEDYYFDYLARDFGLEVSKRILDDKKSLPEESLLEELNKSETVKIVFISTASKNENERLCNTYPNLRFCFLEKTNIKELLPNTLEKTFINNFNSISRTYSSMSSN